MEENEAARNSPAPPPPASISLRPFTLSDADAMMTWASDPRVTRFQRRAPLSCKADALFFIQHHIIPHPWYRAICLDDDGGRPVGSISVKPDVGDGNRHKASIGYRLACDYWGRGIATAALKMVVAEVFKEWECLERVEAVADVENPASQRVLEKAGFRREGVLRKYVWIKGEARDVVMFSFLATDLQ